MTDKRGNPRVPMLGQLAAEIMVFAPMAVTEVSLDGVTVETRFPLSLDSLHDVRLSLGHRSVVVKGRVVHSHVSDVSQDVVSYQAGLEFVEAPAGVRTLIGEFLDTLKAHRAGL